MSSIKEVEQKYQVGREYKPNYGGPFPIVDWILKPENRGWIKGAERILVEQNKYRIRFVYWEYKKKDWRISRLHPVVKDNIVQEIVEDMKKKKWI